MKITLDSQFFEALGDMDARTCAGVVNTCRQLLESDDRTVENFVLPVGAPKVLVDFLEKLKKRIRTARQRRERTRRRKATSTPAGNGRQAVKRPTSRPDDILDLFTRAVSAVLDGSGSLGHADRAKVKQLTKALMKRMDAIATSMAFARKISSHCPRQQGRPVVARRP